MRLGHAHVLTVHRTVIHYVRAASLRRPLPQSLIFTVGAIHSSPVFCLQYAFVFGTSRAPSPTAKFNIYRRGDSLFARFCLQLPFVFGTSWAPSPTENLIFIVGAIHVSPVFLQTMCVCLRDVVVLVATRSRSRSDSPPDCHSLRSRRFATPSPTAKFNIYRRGDSRIARFLFNVYRKTKSLYVILSAGRRVRPPTEVEVFVRE